MGGGNLNEGIGFIVAITAGWSKGLNPHAFPAMQVVFCPFGFRERPIFSITPLILSHHPVLYWWLLHDAVVDAFEPVVVPPDDFVVERVARGTEVRRPIEQHFLGSFDCVVPVLRSLQVHL